MRHLFPNQFVVNGGNNGSHYLDATRTLDPRFVAYGYGEHQLGAVLANQTTNNLNHAARAMGVERGATKAETISRIVSAVTDGRYTADFNGHAGEDEASVTRPRGTTDSQRQSAAMAEARAQRQAESSARVTRNASAIAAQRRLGLPPEARPGTPLQPLHVDPYFQLDATRPLDPYWIAKQFGNRQVGAALALQTPRALRQAAKIAGVTMGRTRAETISRITYGVTDGQYAADF